MRIKNELCLCRMDVFMWRGTKHKQLSFEMVFLWLVTLTVYKQTFDEYLYSLWALLLFNVLQEAILITLEVAASHSVIPRTFSGNSLAAEIHLQIFLVSFVSWEALMGELKERRTEESHKSGEGRWLLLTSGFYLVKNIHRWPGKI